MTMASATLQARAPFRARFLAYLRARFPLASHSIMIASFTAAAWAVARLAAHPLSPVAIGPRFFLANTCLVLFFFHLRVFDEHKDYQVDCRHHPDRPVQAGIITLGELSAACAAAVAAEFALASAGGLAAALALGVAFMYSLLMLREFFVTEWLQRHFVTYALSHMVVIPLLALTVLGFAVGDLGIATSPAFVLFACNSFCTALGWEVARKIRTPHDEVAGYDTYTSTLGRCGAAALYGTTQVIAGACALWLACRLGWPAWYPVVVVALLSGNVLATLLCATSLSRFSTRLLNGVSGLTLIGLNLATAVAAVNAMGMEWVR